MQPFKGEPKKDIRNIPLSRRFCFRGQRPSPSSKIPSPSNLDWMDASPRHRDDASVEDLARTCVRPSFLVGRVGLSVFVRAVRCRNNRRRKLSAKYLLSSHSDQISVPCRSVCFFFFSGVALRNLHPQPADISAEALWQFIHTASDKRGCGNLFWLPGESWLTPSGRGVRDCSWLIRL